MREEKFAGRLPSLLTMAGFFLLWEVLARRMNAAYILPAPTQIVKRIYELRAPLFLMVVGFIYMAEVISVILQVGYFKATKGKRLFRMAPIHHHFELGGWSETRVVTVFTIVTVILSLAAWIGLGD